MEIPCPACRGKGYQDFYGSVHTREVCAECGGKGKIEFVEKPRSREPDICPYCGQQDCASLIGAPLCGSIE